MTGVVQTSAEVPHASPVDTLRLATTVLTPLVGRGLIIRRPRVVALVERRAIPQQRVMGTTDQVVARARPTVWGTSEW